MFERFTGPARHVVVQALDEARALRHDYIGTEHLLLALIAGRGIASRVLEAEGPSLASARSRVLELVGEGNTIAGGGQVPFAPAAKRALELASEEADSLGHGRVGTEHVLLGLARIDDGPAAQILAEHGLDVERARHAVLGVLAGGRGLTADVAAGEEGWTPYGPTAVRHRLESLPPGGLDEEWLNRLGDEGWELAAVVGDRAVFRRFEVR